MEEWDIMLRSEGEDSGISTDSETSEGSTCEEEEEEEDLRIQAGAFRLSDLMSKREPIPQTGSDDEDTPSNTSISQRQMKLLDIDDVIIDDGRDSPLLEVELTASDEDDDTSVLELVIPMQQNLRYQRVPTKTGKSRETGFWQFICCLPRTK